MIYINIDISDVLNLSEIESAAKTEFDKLGEEVAQAAYDHVLKEAEKKLHTRKAIYIKGLSLGQEDGVHILALEASVNWIEEGQQSFNMLDKLLASPKAKMGKNGKYLVVPFNQNKDLPPSQQNIVQAVKAKMGEKGINFSDIEKHEDGSSKQGLLHKFDIEDSPLRTSQTKKPGQGHGPVGKPVQGNSGIPFLKGVRVYQKDHKDETGKMVTGRFVGTFRTASESQRGSGKWDYPTTEGVQIFKETEEWVVKEIETKYAAKILDRIMANIK